MRFGKSLFHQHKPKVRMKKLKLKVVKCPNCGQKAKKDDSYSCQWCQFPLERTSNLVFGEVNCGKKSSCR